MFTYTLLLMSVQIDVRSGLHVRKLLTSLNTPTQLSLTLGVQILAGLSLTCSSCGLQVTLTWPTTLYFVRTETQV